MLETLNKVEALVGGKELLPYYALASFVAAFLFVMLVRSLLRWRMDRRERQESESEEREGFRGAMHRTLKSRASFREAKTVITGEVEPEKASAILVLDDDEDFLWMIRTVLERRYKVETTSCPDTALNRLQSGQFDVMITDFVMPNTNGIQFVNRIRKHPELTDIPVIVLTGIDDDLVIDVIKATPQVSLFRKNDKVEEILEVIDDLISKQKKVA